MKKFVYLTMLASAVAAAPAVAQDAPSTISEELAQFSPAQQFGYGMFLLSKGFVEIISAPETETNPDAAAEKIDALTETARQLYDLAPSVDKAELQDILSKLLVTPEYNDVQAAGAAAGTRLRNSEFYGSAKLKNSVQTFFFTVMGLQQAAF